MNHKRYKTKGLDCWQKAKELRLDEYRLIRERDENQVLITGHAHLSKAILAGIGKYVYLSGGPYAATVSTNNEFSLQCMKAVEAKGYASELCAYVRNYIGSMFINRYFFGGEFPKIDLVLFDHSCDSSAKWCQVIAEYLKIPSFCIDLPEIADNKEPGNSIKYLVNQMHMAIEWMEKITRRKYDDEKLIEAVNNQLKVGKYCAEIFLLNQVIPAPLDIKSMFSFMPLSIRLRYKREGVEFFKMLRDEVRERVQNQIAALATERFRLLNITAAPWFFLRLFRYIEKFGCINIGGRYPFSSIGGWGLKQQPDGTYTVADIPEDSGTKLKNRDDALRALAISHVNNPFVRAGCKPWEQVTEQQRLVKQWHADGMMMHLDRSCRLTSGVLAECKLALQKEGIPVLFFEGNRSDARNLNETEVINSIDAFMETQGLKILED